MAGLSEPRRTWSEEDRLGWMREVSARVRWGTFTLNPGSIAANSTEDTTVTAVSGQDIAQLRAGQFVQVTPPTTLESGLTAGGAWVSADGTLTVRIANVTGGSIDPASAVWNFKGDLI